MLVACHLQPKYIGIGSVSYEQAQAQHLVSHGESRTIATVERQSHSPGDSLHAGQFLELLSKEGVVGRSATLHIYAHQGVRVIAQRGSDQMVNLKQHEQ